ncbi:hypothetical protein EF913_28240 [Streptomyces sp. WAC04189]|uniref:hypothetical protein n=1 Tax=Streptomyces sp. WAC04189 TaxID=2487411 RepID=UPI000FA56A2E|nr:hypothetical protein [Streptomyces sp. WAC04189]RSR98022.1 hypothetical protein EF913_28240 [Streptomyces sp. WAC04189]
MRVVVREAFRAYINMQPEDFTVGQKIKGDTAVRLLRSGAAVDPDDDAAHELAAQLRGDEGDGQEQDDGGQQEPDPPHEPPAPAGNPDGGPAHPDPSTPPAPPLDAPVKDLLAWVGEDPARAREVLEAEETKDSPRSTLVKQLQKIADA